MSDPIAFLFPAFPNLHQTFVLWEVLALRERGVDIALYSIKRPLTESLVKTVLQSCWTNGGNPDLIMVGPFNKTVFSGFTGNATRLDQSEDKKLISTIDVYESDFGAHKIVASRFSRERDCHILDSSLWGVAYLRKMQTIDLAKTGDAEKGMVLAEYTLEARNQAGSGIVADLTTS